jgi:glycine/D-amino acid oxidase-like deaminating enzyme
MCITPLCNLQAAKEASGSPHIPMDKLRIGTSYWVDQFTGAAPRHPPLRGTHHADIAVIGGGITGCLAAQAFVSAGFSVLLLEGQQIARGSTAASTALLMQEPDLDLRDLAARYGTRRARDVWSRSAKSVRGLVALLRRLRITADLQEVRSVYWTSRADLARDLQSELDRRHAAGIAGRWLNARGLERLIGVGGAGGILTHGNAQVDPYRACLGLAARLRAAGAKIYERSPVRRLRGSSHGVRIDLDTGEVSAQWAVIATGYATPEFKPLAGRFRMSSTYVITTAPLDRRLHRRMAADVMWWDTETPYHYSRWTPDRRVLFGGRDIPQVSKRARSTMLLRQTEQLRADLTRVYPALEHTAIHYAWDGLFATTRDGLPYIGTHRRYPRQLFALGYGGNGMTFGFLAAEVLINTVRNTLTASDRFFGFHRIR